MLRATLNKSRRQHPTKQRLNGHLLLITKTIKVRRTRYAGHCWRSMDELISDVRLWTPSHGRSKAGRPARTYIQQLCADTGCSLKTCLEQWTMARERVRDIRANGATWWWFICFTMIKIYCIYRICLRFFYHSYRYASESSQVQRSAIGNHVADHYICRTNYSDDSFSVLYKARCKQYLAFLEAIAIMLYCPTFCTGREDHFTHFVYLGNGVGIVGVEGFWVFFIIVPSSPTVIWYLHYLNDSG